MCIVLYNTKFFDIVCLVGDRGVMNSDAMRVGDSVIIAVNKFPFARQQVTYFKRLIIQII